MAEKTNEERARACWSSHTLKTITDEVLNDLRVMSHSAVVAALDAREREVREACAQWHDERAAECSARIARLTENKFRAERAREDGSIDEMRQTQMWHVDAATAIRATDATEGEGGE